MDHIVNLKDFLKPSFEAIQNERTKSLLDLLKSDGGEVAKSLLDFVTDAFCDIADGATCLEFEKQTENLEIYVNIKRKGQNES